MFDFLRYVFDKYVCLHKKMTDRIKTHKDLIVYNLSFEAGIAIFKISKSFPRDEVFSLTDQIRRSSRAVSANISEAFRKRRYPKSFISKLSNAEGEAAETQVWLDYSLSFGYIQEEEHGILYAQYDRIIGMLVNMMKAPSKWSW